VTDGGKTDDPNGSKDAATPDGGAPDPDAPAPPVDGAVPIDAAVDAPGGSCTPTSIQLLKNEAFDKTPLGSDWQETRKAEEVALIGKHANIIGVHTEPNAAWLCGFNSSDQHLVQQIAVPAGTTALTLSGSYAIKTQEWGSSIYDKGWIEVEAPGGTPEKLKEWSDNDETSGWAGFSKAATSAYAGQTITFRFRCTTDSGSWTVFIFDTLTLTATVCQ